MMDQLEVLADQPHGDHEHDSTDRDECQKESGNLSAIGLENLHDLRIGNDER